MDKTEKKLKQVLSGVAYFIFHKALCKDVDHEGQNTVESHQKKLKILTNNCVLPFDLKDVATSIFSYTSTDDECEVLKFGLSHSIVPRYISRTDRFSSFESVFSSMTSRLINKNDENELISDLSHLAHLYVISFKLSPKDIKTRNILRNRHKNDNIVILKPHKGNGMVIFNRTDYTKRYS